MGRGRASRPLALDEEAKCLFKRPRRLPVGEKLFDDLLVWRDDFRQNVSANNPNLGTQLVTEGIQHCWTGGSARACDNERMSSDPIVSDAEKQEKILNVLQTVLDPEIGLSVIDLDLIREVSFTAEEAEIKMVLTTPFCPYGPMLTNQIQSVSEQAAEMPVKVTVLPDKWEAPPWLR